MKERGSASVFNVFISIVFIMALVIGGTYLVKKYRPDLWARYSPTESDAYLMEKQGGKIKDLAEKRDESYQSQSEQIEDQFMQHKDQLQILEEEGVNK